MAKGHVVHIVAEDTPTRRAGLCGAIKGHGWIGSPVYVSWLEDRWCSKCWKRWEAKGLTGFKTSWL